MRKPKIYISSTFFDLARYRHNLIEYLRKTESFDIICMENYGTRDKPPLDKCLEDVRSAEFYILLQGQRYGFIPENHIHSITHLEFLEAIKKNGPEHQFNGHHRCVLPFILDGQNIYTDEIKASIQEEETRDGAALTSEKKTKLQEWRKYLQANFVLDLSEPISTPADLSCRVLGAIVPVLMTRDFKDSVNKLELKDDLAFRCNRELVRNDFIIANAKLKDFFKVFIIHGDTPEMPEAFTNNITAYELPLERFVTPMSMDVYMGNALDAEDFRRNFVMDVCKSFAIPYPADMTKLKSLGDAILQHDDLTTMAVLFEVDFPLWNERYKELMVPFFKAIKTFNTGVANPKGKAFYIFINVRYESQNDKISTAPPSSIMLRRLSTVQKSSIKNWIKFYLLNTRDNKSLNKMDEKAKQIMSHYFPGERKEYTMQETIKELDQIITDFNENKNAFSNS
jgi:hypothetical protein